jgi:hypothetical protein
LRFLLSFLLLFTAVSRAFAAPEPDAVPLPRGIEYGGIVLQIDGAGFGSPADVIPDESQRLNDGPSFYFSYRAHKTTTAGELGEAVRPTALIAPDGGPLRLSSAAPGISTNTPKTVGGGQAMESMGHTLFYANVSPDWKSVRAEFEVRNLLAPPGDAGAEVSHHELKDIELPTGSDKMTTSTPGIEVVTPRGTKFTLDKIEREGEVLRFLGHATPLETATDYEVDFEKPHTSYDGAAIASNNYLSDDSRYVNLNIRDMKVPTTAKTVTLSFDVKESARSWRKTTAFSLLSFEIPVAQLWKAAPLAVRPPAIPFVTAKNDDFEARWESLIVGKGEWDYNRSRLWLCNIKPDAALGEWTPKSVDFEHEGKPVSLFSWGMEPSGIFHNDGSLRREGETGHSLQLVGFALKSVPSNVDLTIKAQRARTVLTGHALKNVPLPAIDSMREYGPDEFNDGTWKLRRTIWLEGEEFRKQLGYSEKLLILTFERNPVTHFEDDSMMPVEDIFYDEKGERSVTSMMFDPGDPMMKGAEKSRVSLYLSLPPHGTKQLSLNMRVMQRVWSGPVQTLVLPGVPINPAPPK